MVKNPWTGIRQAGSLMAGLLIGVSLVFAAFAMADSESNAWQDLLVYGAPIFLALGIALQAAVTAGLRRRPAIRVADAIFPGALPIPVEA
jgi:hypothetical protein